ncbi:MAG: V-type ATP synthase subunit E [Thermoproteota archaeon]|nr:V-type ATP synthase subunit E [Candidatus Brockarchaeota archaeon]
MSSSNVVSVSESTKSMAEIVLNHAKEQREAIIREAEKRAKEVVDQAKVEAQEKKVKLIEYGKKELNRLKEQEIVKIKMELKKRLYAYEWNLVNSLISKSLSTIESIRDKKEMYKKYLMTSISGALNLIDEDEVVVHVDKRDLNIVEDLIKNIQTTKKIRIVPDITTSGGIIVTSKDGLKEINETVEARLKLKNQVIREKLYNFLFGDLNVRNW